MSVRKLKPITPGQRFRVVNGYDAITTDKPEKSLLAPNKRSGGRNNQGRMTTRNIGGGHKQRYLLSILKEIKTVFLQQLKLLSTIQIVQHLLRLLVILMVKNVM